MSARAALDVAGSASLLENHVPFMRDISKYGSCEVAIFASEREIEHAMKKIAASAVDSANGRRTARHAEAARVATWLKRGW